MSNALNIAAQLIAEEEGEGKNGLGKVFKDPKGILTIGRGFNLEQKNAASILKQAGIKKSLEELKKGKASLSLPEVGNLFVTTINIAQQTLFNKLKRAGLNPNTLTANQEAALISLTFNNPKLVGTNIIEGLRTGNFRFVEEDIRFFSNRKNKRGKRSRGLDVRREREAELFAGGPLRDRAQVKKEVFARKERPTKRAFRLAEPTQKLNNTQDTLQNLLALIGKSNFNNSIQQSIEPGLTPLPPPPAPPAPTPPAAPFEKFTPPTTAEQDLMDFVPIAEFLKQTENP